MRPPSAVRRLSSAICAGAEFGENFFPDLAVVGSGRGCATQPNPRLGAPADVAGAAIFLASPASDYITGQVLFVDGGKTAASPWPFEP